MRSTPEADPRTRTSHRVALVITVVVALVVIGLGAAWKAGAFDRAAGEVATGNAMAGDYPWYPTWSELMAASSAVVSGTVTGLETRVFDGDITNTVATVHVNAVATGSPAAGATIEVAYPGPGTPVGQYLESGKEYVLVLTPYGEQGVWQFADPVQCVYPVVDGAVRNISPNTYLPPSDVLAALGLA